MDDHMQSLIKRRPGTAEVRPGSGCGAVNRISVEFRECTGRGVPRWRDDVHGTWAWLHISGCTLQALRKGVYALKRIATLVLFTASYSQLFLGITLQWLAIFLPNSAFDHPSWAFQQWFLFVLMLCLLIWTTCECIYAFICILNAIAILDSHTLCLLFFLTE